MSDDREGPVSVHASQAFIGQTSEGDVIFQMSKPPPEGHGVLCPVKGCGAYNWPHARYCRECAYDFREKRRVLLGSLVIGLLVLIATLAFLGLQRI